MQHPVHQWLPLLVLCARSRLIFCSDILKKNIENRCAVTTRDDMLSSLHSNPHFHQCRFVLSQSNLK